MPDCLPACPDTRTIERGQTALTIVMNVHTTHVCCVVSLVVSPFAPSVFEQQRLHPTPLSLCALTLVAASLVCRQPQIPPNGISVPIAGSAAAWLRGYSRAHTC